MSLTETATMHRTKSIALFLLAPIFLGACSNYQSTPVSPPATSPEESRGSQIHDEQKRSRDNEKRWKETSALEFLKISALKKKNPGSGVYETEGYVVKTVGVCDCPPGAKCDCENPSITISEKNQPPKESQLLDAPHEITIDTNPEGFKLGQKYRLKIEIPERDTPSEPIYYAELVAYRKE